MFNVWYEFFMIIEKSFMFPSNIASLRAERVDLDGDSLGYWLDYFKMPEEALRQVVNEVGNLAIVVESVIHQTGLMLLETNY
jgi:hypothetical protein